ncbi:glycosyltransferase family 2 protein [Fodinibius sp. AD559]|uniref:glycosyltransferase family 2 protein n=1 Tax=Fodinibius sp. AD559 TaxID=3424179 RepID=UPI004046BC8A
MKVSIITPCYNSEATIIESVQSVQDQSYDNIEHIIIDGNSEDETLEVLHNYRAGIDKLISENDEGIYNAINKGILRATGDIIGILNADDKYISNDVIEMVVASFKKEETSAVYGDLQYLDSNADKLLRNWEAGPFALKKFENGWMPPHPTLFVRSELYEEYGLYNEEFDIAADYELILRFLYKNEVPVSYIPEVLVQMRSGGVSNDGLKSRIQAFIEDYKAWKNNDLGTMTGLKAQILKRTTKIEQFFPFFKEN